ISARSSGHVIDRMVLFHTNTYNGNAQDLNLPESSFSSVSTGQPVEPTPEPVIGSTGLYVATGEMKKWHPVELTFEGPYACESWSGGVVGGDFNPFMHRRLNVTFSNGGTSYTVPGFFNGDGNTEFTNERTPSQECGNKWTVRFTPDQTGTWNFTTSFRQGSNIAIDLNPNAGAPGSIDGISGSLQIADTDKTGDDLRGKGILRYVGEHYPRFDNGEYYIKTGSDSPENFMGYVDFHNTFDHEIRSQFGPFVHTYETHANDYNLNPGQLWGQNRDQGRTIYGAVNYLNSIGVNSVYMINYGIDGGDGGDTWVWSCPNQIDPNCNEDKLRFDISKMEQWDLVYRHMTEQGIQLHFVLNETENDKRLSGTQWRLYYREMIARFGYNNAMVWNLGEENFWHGISTNDRYARQLEQAEYIRAIDPLNHRITVHSINNQADSYYNGLLGTPNFEATSIQGRTRDYNRWAIDLRRRSAEAGRPWIIYGDEQPDQINRNLDNWGTLRDQALWGNLMGGGGGVQWYIAYQSSTFGDVNLTNFRLLEPVYQDSATARRFFEEHLTDFEEYQPANELVNASSGNAYALAKAGDFYAVYFEDAFSNKTLDLREAVGNFKIAWYSPRTGRFEAANAVTGGSVINIGSPPFLENSRFNGDSTRDYAMLVYRVGLGDGSTDPIPTPINTATPFPTPLPSPTLVPGTENAARFFLVDAIANTTIGQIVDGESINLATLTNTAVNVVAEFDSGIGSAVFQLSGQEQHFQNENVAPYALFGDNSGNYEAWYPQPGDYTLTVTGYTGTNGGGSVYQQGTINISFIEEIASAGNAATPLPTNTPV
ncbi:MAG: DUF5060 domain-containing protein, partial [Chloroflexota bacterium]